MQIRQAKARAEKAEAAGRKQDKDEANDRVDLCNAAEVWSKATFHKRCLEDLRVSYLKLSDLNKVVPVGHRAAYSARKAVEYLKAQNYKAWIECAWPFPTPSQPGGWSVATPVFGTLFDELANPDEDEFKDKSEDDGAAKSDNGKPDCKSAGELTEAQSALMNEWQAAFFGDTWLALMDQLPETEAPIAVVERVMACFNTASFDIEDFPWFAKLWEDTMKALRGVAALLFATPLKFGSAMDDVVFIKGMDIQNSILNSDIAVKRSLHRRMKRDSPWSNLYDTWDKTKHLDIQHGKAMMHLESAIAGASLASDAAELSSIGDVAKSLEPALKDIKVWQTDLRPGATDELQQTIVTAVRKVIEVADTYLAADDTSIEDRSFCMQTLESVQAVLGLCTIDEAEQPRQTASNLHATWGTKDKVTSLLHMITTLQPSAPTLAALEKALSAASAIAKPKQFYDALPQLVEGLMDHTGLWVAETEPADDMLSAHINIIKILGKDRQACDCMGGRTKFSLFVKHFAAVTGIVLKSKIACSALAAQMDKDPLDILGPAVVVAATLAETRPQHDLLPIGSDSSETATYLKASKVINELVDMSDDTWIEAREPMTEAAQKVEEAHCAAVKNAAEELKQVAYGGPNGTSWHIKFNPLAVDPVHKDALALFKATLHQIQTQNLEEHSQKARKVNPSHELRRIANPPSPSRF